MLAGEQPVISTFVALSACSEQEENEVNNWFLTRSHILCIINQVRNKDMRTVIIDYLLHIDAFNVPDFLFPALSYDVDDHKLSIALLNSLQTPNQSRTSDSNITLAQQSNYKLKPYLHYVYAITKAALNRKYLTALHAGVTLLVALYTPAHTSPLNDYFTSSRTVKLTLYLFEASLAAIFLSSTVISLSPRASRAMKH